MEATHFFYISEKGEDGMRKNILELEQCTDVSAIDAILEAQGKKTSQDKLSFLLEYMCADAHGFGNIGIELQYTLAKEEFMKGYWRDYNGFAEKDA